MNALKLSKSKQPKKQSTSISSINNEGSSLPKLPGAKNLIPIRSQVLQNQLSFKCQISEADSYELTYILKTILNYPSLSQARTHSLVSRLGSFDIKKQNSHHSHIAAKEYCRCCGYVKQEEKIPLCTSFNSFPSVGISTFLFFETIRSLIAILTIVLTIFGIYALISNLILSGIFVIQQGHQSQLSFSVDRLIEALSLKNKISSNTNSAILLYVIQMWIGVLTVLVWSLLLYLVGYFQNKYVEQVDLGTISAADFSIRIDNYPIQMNMNELQKQINNYGLQFKQTKEEDWIIEKINLSKNLQIDKQQERSLDSINEKYNQMLELFANWICDYEQKMRLPGTFQKRLKQYIKFHKLKNQRLKKGRHLINTLYSMNSTSSNNSFKKRTIAFITFRYSQTKDLLIKHVEQNWLHAFQWCFSCIPKLVPLVLKDMRGRAYHNILIRQAPQPEDIIWQNLHINQVSKILRRLTVYLTSLLILVGSFCLVYFMSKSQLNEENIILNFAISLAISVINFIIGFIIRAITVLERDHTQTQYQTSLAIKSIIAQLINSILIPIIVNEILEKSNIYGRNGLSTDIIYLSITNSFLAPLSKIIDPYYRFIKVKAYYIRSSLKICLLLKQSELNSSQELMQFETGYEYIYFINLYLFTAFFLSLQPVIIIPALIGMFIMYWAQKYSLLNRMKRPIPGTQFMNVTMRQMINMGPIFFSFGSLCWSHFFGEYKVGKADNGFFIPNIVGGALSVFLFFFPFNLVFEKYFSQQIEEKLIYKECKIHMNSEYDRVNPATMENAIKQYEQFLENFDPVLEEGSNSEDEFFEKNEIHIDPKLTTLQKNIERNDIFDKKQKKRSGQIYLANPPNSKNMIQILNQNLKNKQFLMRKKEILKNRNRNRINSKIIDNGLGNTLGQFLGNNLQHQDNDNEFQNFVDDDILHQQVQLSSEVQEMKVSELNPIKGQKLIQKQIDKNKLPQETVISLEENKGLKFSSIRTSGGRQNDSQESAIDFIKNQDLVLNQIIVKPRNEDNQSKYAINSILQPSSFISNLKETINSSKTKIKKNRKDKSQFSDLVQQNSNKNSHNTKMNEIEMDIEDITSKIENDFIKIFPRRQSNDTIQKNDSKQLFSCISTDPTEYFGKNGIFKRQSNINPNSQKTKNRWNPFDKAFG